MRHAEFVSATAASTHLALAPAILYFGTPVVLVSTLNEDGSANLAPMSSAWWLGWSCMLGLDASSKTTENLIRTGQCVLNLPSADQADAVDRIALTSGSDPLPPHKQAMGFQHVADKFARAGLTGVASDAVAPPRVVECPIQLEAALVEARPVCVGNPGIRIPMKAIEVRIERVHVRHDLVIDGTQRIHPDRWKPLIMSFREFYTLGERIQPSRLAGFPEEYFRPRPSRAPVG